MKWKQLAYSTLFATSLISCMKSDDDELNTADRDFMAKAAISNEAEINSAFLAIEKANNGAVKSYAQHMIMEYEAAQNDLKNVGSSVGYAIADTVDPAHTALIEQLNALEGYEFDSVYMNSQVKLHQDALANFQNGQTNGQHAEVRNYINTYYPNIQLHFERADSIAKAFFN